MKKLVTTVVFLAGAAAFAGAPVAAKFELKGDMTRGEAVFKQFCIPCHGESGKGDGPAGAALNPKPADFTDTVRAAKSTDEQLYNLIKEGGQAFGKSPLMVSWKATLNDQQIRDVESYIRNFSKKAAGTKPASAPKKN